MGPGPIVGPRVGPRFFFEGGDGSFGVKLFLGERDRHYAMAFG